MVIAKRRASRGDVHHDGHTCSGVFAYSMKERLFDQSGKGKQMKLDVTKQIQESRCAALLLRDNSRQWRASSKFVTSQANLLPIKHHHCDLQPTERWEQVRKT